MIGGTGFSAVHTIGIVQIETELTHTMTLSWRYVLAWMGCFGLMNVYFCRINLSVAMVAMVGVEQVPADNVTETSSTCKAR